MVRLLKVVRRCWRAVQQTSCHTEHHMNDTIREEQEPAPPQRKPTPLPVRCYLLGIVPLTIGTALLLMHLRKPLVSGDHTVVLAAMWLGLLCGTLTIWRHYSAQRNRGDLEARLDNIGHQVDSLKVKLDGLCASAASRHEATMQQVKRSKGTKRLVAIENQIGALSDAFIETGDPTGRARVLQRRWGRGTGPTLPTTSRSTAPRPGPRRTRCSASPPGTRSPTMSTTSPAPADPRPAPGS